MDHELLASNVDAIYAVAREDFTGERDRRAKQLRADDHREEAAALRSHRKPTLPAWVVNQLARRFPDEVVGLINAAEQLRDVQRRAASGRGGAGIREATQQLRRSVADLREHARELLQAAGSRPEAHLDEVGQVLFAAAVGQDHHETLRRGVFVTVPAGAGFGAVDAMALVGGTAAVEDPVRDNDDDAGSDEPDTAAGTSTLEAAAQEERRRQADRERQRQADLRRAAQRRELEQRQGQLRRSKERQQRRTERAEATLAQLRTRMSEAATDANEQRAALERIDQQLADLEEELNSLDG